MEGTAPSTSVVPLFPFPSSLIERARLPMGST